MKEQRNKKEKAMIDKGTQLYKNILKSVHKNNIEEMYNYFNKKVEFIESYGDTIEKRLLNYCIYKENLVKLMYNIT